MIVLVAYLVVFFAAALVLVLAVHGVMVADEARTVAREAQSRVAAQPARATAYDRAA